MFEMRIDIIRKELERRYEEISEFKGDAAQFKEVLNPFIHFLVSDSLIKPRVIELFRYNDDFLASEKFNEIKAKAIKHISQINNLIGNANIIDYTAKSDFNQANVEYQHIISALFPPLENGDTFADFYFKILKEPEKYKAPITNNLNQVIAYYNRLIEFAQQRDEKFDRSLYAPILDNLNNLSNTVSAYFNYQAEFEGATAAVKLLSIYLNSPYNYISRMDRENLGKFVIRERVFAQLINESNNYLDAQKYCTHLYWAVDRFLSTYKSKSFLIDRLITYCSWIKRDQFPKPETKNKESKISGIIGEFIFNYGYFPIVNFKTGKSEPDILAEPNARWDNSILIELKQIIGGKPDSYTITQLEEDIGQARDYLSIIKGVKPDIADMVYLLVFYDGEYRISPPASYSKPDDVRVEFIYVGEKSPSKLGNKILDDKRLRKKVR